MADDGFLPPGFYFHPSDELLVVYYLRHYVFSGESPHEGLVTPADVYGTEPWNLLVEGQKEAFFYARRTRISAKGKRVSRKAGKGSWQLSTNDDVITSSVDGRGEVTVGIKHNLSYKYKGKKNIGWIMHEYELCATDGPNKQDFQEVVLCHLKVRNQDVNRAQKAERDHDSSLSGCQPLTTTQDSTAPLSSWFCHQQVLQCKPLAMVPPEESSAPAGRHDEYSPPTLQVVSMDDTDRRDVAAREVACSRGLLQEAHGASCFNREDVVVPSEEHEQWFQQQIHANQCGDALLPVPPVEHQQHEFLLDNNSSMWSVPMDMPMWGYGMFHRLVQANVTTTASTTWSAFAPLPMEQEQRIPLANDFLEHFTITNDPNYTEEGEQGASSINVSDYGNVDEGLPWNF